MTASILRNATRSQRNTGNATYPAIAISNIDHTASHFIQQIRRCKDLTSLHYTHTNVLKRGVLSEILATNHIIVSYVKLEQIEDARKLFDEMSEPNVVSWTSVMAGYINVGRPEISIRMFRKMTESWVIPNSFTFSSVVNACSILADVKTGKAIHARVEVFGFQCHVFVSTSLIDMYGKCNNVDEARRVFDSMSYKNVVTWNSMIVTYTQNALGEIAITLFKEFNLVSNCANQFMFATVINTCASLGRLLLGKVAHCGAIRRGHSSNDVVASALVDMYAKCGCLSYSNKVFHTISNPSVIPYTSIIVGTAKYGNGKLALELFKKMVDSKVKPNDVTFVGVLHACSHSGLINEGLKYFETMYAKYGVLTDVKHHTCVVDMLGRVGRIDEAHKIAKSIRVKPEEGALLWGTILSSSRLSGREDIAIEASEWLIESNQQVAAAYVTMSNTYAMHGKWENVEKTRFQMRQNGIFKKPGCSWIEIEDNIYVFYAGDLSSCSRGSEVFELLKEFETKMREMGYVGGSKDSFSVEIEEEEEVVSLHSERLALGFALISIPKGITIRIMKNLRVCADCHEAFKLISKIVKRDFVVRDVNRFHCFENGSCSCNDFW